MKTKFILLFCIVLFSLTFISAFAGGVGSLEDPFQITNCSELQEMKDYISNYFILMNDIDCSSINPFIPSVSFVGTFRGQGYIISNLTISCSAEFCGLFSGYFSGSVSNLRLVGVSITGGQLHTGGIAGVNNGGTINLCSVTGIVTGSSYTGGLVGENVGTISNSFSTASVTGDWNSGGLVGKQTGGSISNSYSTGTVSGGGENMGGLLGLLQVGTCTNSFWDIQTSGQTTSACGTGKTTAEMKTLSTFSDVGWVISPTSNNLNEGYPYLVGSSWFIYVEEPEEQPIQGVGRGWESDTLISQSQLPSEDDEEEVITKVSLFGWFQNIINWFKRLFN